MTALLTALFLATPSNAAPEALPAVEPVPEALREKLKLDPFYQKLLSLDGFPILGSARVSDEAMLEAAWIIQKMVSQHPAILQTLQANDARLVVMAYNEYTTDVIGS